MRLCRTCKTELPKRFVVDRCPAHALIDLAPRDRKREKREMSERINRLMRRVNAALKD